MSYLHYVEKLKKGETVSFRPKGNSMTPRIKSGELVTIEPSLDIEVGDAVFCKVRGNFYVHLVKAIKNGEYQIGNNHGRINGWTKNVYGKVTQVSP